jgi:hypothetical protein
MVPISQTAAFWLILVNKKMANKIVNIFVSDGKKYNHRIRHA